MNDRPRRLILSLLFAAALGAASMLAAAPASPAPPTAAPSARHRVILLSLDGASAETLRELHRAGALTAGGFERFFRDGQVADHMVPANPPLTAVNHATLATGYPASQTGIVGNHFHAAGAPFLDTVSGFDAPIGTETLWEAASRQGKQVGVIAWPSVDATVPRRRGDWGLLYAKEPIREPGLVTLARKDWMRPPPGPFQGIPSYSPFLESHAKVGREGQGGQEFDLLAIDSSDDGKVSYDAVMPLTSSDPFAIKPGDWGRVPCQDTRPNLLVRSTFCWIKVLSVDPDLGTARLYFSGLYANQGYPQTFNIALAEDDLLWPGPPDDDLLSASWQGRPGIDLATWSEQSDRFTTFFGGVLREAAGRSDWDLLLAYLPSIDEAGHELLLLDPRQPGYSKERRDALAAARTKVWQNVDRELARFLKTVDLRSTTVVIVSDHGMAPVHTAFDPDVPLRGRGLLAAGADGKPQPGARAYAVSGGGIAHVYVDPAAPGREKLIADLRALFSGWSEGGKKPVARVFTRKEAAAIGLDHPNSGDLILFAAEGFGFTANGLKDGRALLPPSSYGMHGYLNSEPRMQSIYLALGAGIKPGPGGTVQATDVAARVASWLGIEKPRPKPE